ncbi:hypothetical protein, partial [Nocardiopsis sp. JB363]|uniref:hypothetical protein n=1 Tax=Nocardiopsis sp. JB363 TaxID=1434837 RepID=UPI00135B712E
MQTAVTGDPHSADPAYMPTDPDEAEEFRAQALAGEETHWCGTLLGGCGGRLALKIIRERDTVPHFSHRGDSNLCARLARGGEHTLGGQSADHLYAHRHLRTWLTEHQRSVPEQVEYVGLAPGKACTEVVIPLTGTTSLRIVLTSDLDHELLEIARSPIARDYVWLVRANSALTRTLFQHGVPYRLIRLVPGKDHGRAVEVGLPDGSGEPAWTPLAQCVLGAGTLYRAPSATLPAPPAPRHEPSPTSEKAPDPLEQAVHGLLHALTTGEARGAIITWAQTVQRQLRAARKRGLAPDLAVEARAALDQATVAIRSGSPSPEPADRKQEGTRAAGQHERVQQQARRQKTEEERAQRERQHREIARQVRRVVGNLDWAKAYRRSIAYEDNRAKLEEFLTRPDTPPGIIDQVNGHLGEFPADLFTPEQAPAGKGEPRPGRRRGRCKKEAPRGGHRRTEEHPEPAVPRPRPVLEIQATIDDRSRQILEELRASRHRPTPRTVT